VSRTISSQLARSSPSRPKAGNLPAVTVSIEPRWAERRQRVFQVLGAFFVGNALLAELIGGKLFQVYTPWHVFTLSCGVVLWPFVFVMTDVVNEYFGRAGVRRLSFLAAGVISYAFAMLWLTQYVHAAPFSPIDDRSFTRVFLQSRWIIVGSIFAFLCAQLVDVTVFWVVRHRTGGRHLWLRATGSTVVSQFIDTFAVGFIGLYLPARLGQTYSEIPFTFADFLNTSTSGYAFKFAVAVAVTPLLYGLHSAIHYHLGPAAEAVEPS
jgi:uncharacterized integral membrane protein (TIGR00697 family)